MNDLKEVVSLLAANRWPFRLHATYDESITRFQNVFEEVNREVPFKGSNWFFDHCETISDRNRERVKALGAEWSPLKVFGGYGAPLDVRKAAHAGAPLAQIHEHSAGCDQHGCAHAARQLLAGLEAARNPYAGFWSWGCDCFAF